MRCSEGGDHRRGPSRGDRRGREAEALRSIVGRHCSSLGVRRGCSSLRVLRGQLTESSNYRRILDQKQCGVVKCRGREKDGEKLAVSQI